MLYGEFVALRLRHMCKPRPENYSGNRAGHRGEFGHTHQQFEQFHFLEQTNKKFGSTVSDYIVLLCVFVLKSNVKIVFSTRSDSPTCLLERVLIYVGAFCTRVIFHFPQCCLRRCPPTCAAMRNSRNMRWSTTIAPSTGTFGWLDGFQRLLYIPLSRSRV